MLALARQANSAGYMSAGYMSWLIAYVCRSSVAVGADGSGRSGMAVYTCEDVFMIQEKNLKRPPRAEGHLMSRIFSRAASCTYASSACSSTAMLVGQGIPKRLLGFVTPMIPIRMYPSRPNLVYNLYCNHVLIADMVSAKRSDDARVCSAKVMHTSCMAALPLHSLNLGGPSQRCLLAEAAKPRKRSPR